MDIKEIEQQLTTLVATDKKTWVEFYKLLQQVEDNKLYEAVGQRSFTAWVKSFSLANKVHESVIWSRKKAGKVYEKYQKRQADKGLEVVALENIDVSADSLVLVEKIANKDAELGAEVIEKVLNNELTREDLRRAYRTLRDVDRPTGKNSPSETKEVSEKSTEAKIEDAKTTAALTQTLMEFGDRWQVAFAREIGKAEPNLKRNVGEYAVHKCKSFAEFAVYTGTSRKSRRIDVLTVENYYSEAGAINLHGIEVKVSKGDLTRDTKYTEYSEFVDFLWVAIPSELLETALEVAPKEVGIIIYNKPPHERYKELEMHRIATRLQPSAKEEALTSLVLKTI